MRGAHDAGGAGGAGLLVVAAGALAAGDLTADDAGGAVDEAGVEGLPTGEGVVGAAGEEQATAKVAAATRTAVGRVRWWPRPRGLWRIVRAYPRRASSRVTCRGDAR
jgi:hypothetical protein